MKDQKMQLKAEYAIEDEEWAERREVLSSTQKEHWKAEDKKRQQVL